ncbi:MAG TPA: PEP-CTERM sorting domain-containing protein [Pirellulales bacterium]|nr:PEP-CTERM sorting domain-containing protein [Pirellulales bacterium]
MASLLVVVSAVALQHRCANAASIAIGYLSPIVENDETYYEYNSVTVDSGDHIGTFVQNSDGTSEWSMTGDNYYVIPGYLKMQWDVTLDADPQVSGFVGLTNNSGFVNTFTVTVTQPLATPIPNSMMNGTTAWTVTDGDSNGATLDAATGVGGDALYNAQVDGNMVRQLFTLGNSPLPLMAAVDGSSTITTSFSGEVTPVAANMNIGIFHHFTLTPNDSASATSLFKITAVPEPSSISLLLIGLGCFLLALCALRF